MGVEPLVSERVAAALAMQRLGVAPSTALQAFFVCQSSATTVSQWLVEQGLLNEEQKAELETLTRSLLEQHGWNARAACESLGLSQELMQVLAEVPAARALATLPLAPASGATLAPLDRTMAAGGTIPLPQQTLAGDATLPLAPSQLGTQASHTPSMPADESKGADEPKARFTKISFLARGNLGEVFIAEDRELNRKVALKEISPRSADQRDSRRRFLIEGEVTGRLEHPGIVPVYGMGFGDDGRPYYAMRLIEGRSLQEVLGDFHTERTERTRLSGTRAVEFRQLLGRIIQVCEAIEFAHSRGILHRDIKPSNIMVGPFGETLVVDWGLAKSYEMLDPSTSITVDSVSGESLESNSGSDKKGTASQSRTGTQESDRVVPGLTPAAQTIAGSMVGTPAYMSPEQASGDLATVGPAADVYSLGATLYHFLTGQPPIEGKDLATVLHRVRTGKIIPPRRHWRAIPKSLEAICLKALAKDPDDRYSSARALAEDLQRFVADEPVRCHQAGLLERSMRWARQHQTLSVSLGAASLALVATLTVAFGIVSATNRKLVISESAERSAKERAHNALLLAEEKTKEAELASVVADEAKELAEANAAKAEQNRLAAEENATAERLAREEAVRQQLQAQRTTEFLSGIFQTADALGLNSVPFFIRRNTGESLTVNELLARGRERIANELEDSPETRAAILNSIGNAYRYMGEFEQAQETLEESLAIRRQFLAPDHPDLARSVHDLAFALHELGLYDQAETLYREALAIQQQVNGVESQEAASVEFNLAWLVGQAGDPEEGCRMMRHVFEVRKQQDDDRMLAYAQLGLAISQLEAGHQAESTVNLLAAQSRLQALDGTSPIGNAVFEFMWGYLNPFKRETHFKTALENAKVALGDDHIYVGFGHYLLAQYYIENDRFPEAIEHLERCWVIAETQTRMRHPRILFAIDAYTYLLDQLDRRSEGHLRWQVFLDAQEEAFGLKSPRCADAWYNYALYCDSRKENKTRRDALRISCEGFSSVDIASIPKALLESYEDVAYKWGLELARIAGTNEAKRLPSVDERTEAEKWFAISESVRPQVASMTDPDGLWMRAERALNLTRLGQHAEAIELLREFHDALGELEESPDELKRSCEHYHRIETIAYCGAELWPEAVECCQATGENVADTQEDWLSFARLAGSAGNACRPSGDAQSLAGFRALVIKGLSSARAAGLADFKSLENDSSIGPWVSDPEFMSELTMIAPTVGAAQAIRAISSSPSEND